MSTAEAHLPDAHAIIMTGLGLTLTTDADWAVRWCTSRPTTRLRVHSFLHRLLQLTEARLAARLTLPDPMQFTLQTGPTH